MCNTMIIRFLAQKFVFPSAFLLVSALGAHAASIMVAQKPTDFVPEANRTQEPAPVGGEDLKYDIEDAASAPADSGVSSVAERNEPTIKLESIDVQGMTIFSSVDIEGLYAGLIGTDVTLSEIRAVSDEITQLYRTQGYVISRALIPQQSFENGKVTIQVFEGYIADIRNQSENEEAQFQLVRRFLEPLLQEKPIRQSSLERRLLLANDLPGYEVVATLKPAKNAIAASDLYVAITKKTVSGSITMSNYGSRYIGPGQLITEVSLNSPFDTGSTVSLGFSKGYPFSRSTFKELRVDVPVMYDGMRFKAHYGQTKSNPAREVEEFDLSSEVKKFGATLSYPIVRSRQKNLTLSAGMHGGNSHVSTLGATTVDENERHVYIGLDASMIDSFSGITFGHMNIARGLSGLGGSITTASRVEAENRSLVINGSLSRLQSLGPQFEILLSSLFQWSDDALMASRELALGGKVFGRGYEPSELIGDKGIAGKVELRYRPLLDNAYLSAPMLYGFYDIGMIANNDLSDRGTDRERASLSSLGFGVKFNLFERVKAQFEYARSLTRVPNWRTYTNKGHAHRGYFSLTTEF